MNLVAIRVKTIVPIPLILDYFKRYFVATYVVSVLFGLLFNQRVGGPITILFAIFALLLHLNAGNSKIKRVPIKIVLQDRWLFIGIILVLWSYASLFWGIAGFEVLDRPTKQALYLMAAIVLLKYVSIHRQEFQPETGVIIYSLFGFLSYQEFFGMMPYQDTIDSATYFNRINVIVTLLALSIVGTILIRVKKIWAMSLIIWMAVTSGFFAFSSYSQTSMLIWLVGWTFIPLCYLSGKTVQLLILGLLSLAPLLTLVLLTYGLGFFENLISIDSSWIRESYGGIRLGIWQETIKLAQLKPVFGYGNDALHFIANKAPLMNDLFPGGIIVSSHPHNAYLQILLEFGAVGLILSILFLATVSLCIAKLPAISRPSAIALFASILTVSAVSHGAWQSWWLGTVILMATIVTGLYREDSNQASTD